MANTADNIYVTDSREPDSSLLPTSSTGSAGGGRYRKKDDKRKSDSQTTPGGSPYDSQSESKESNLTDGENQRIKLNRLSEYEVDDVKMANVFGTQPDDKKPVSSSLRLNPLYDQDGTVEVSAEKAQVAMVSEPVAQDSEKSGKNSKKGMYKRPKQTQEESLDEDGLPTSPGDSAQTKINYSKNFRFGKPSVNSEAGSEKGVRKLTTFGVVMPSRVKQNTIPKEHLVTTTGGASQYALGAQNTQGKANIEAASSRYEIRRRWRYVIMLILIILFFGLILTVVLYFATRR